MNSEGGMRNPGTCYCPQVFSLRGARWTCPMCLLRREPSAVATFHPFRAASAAEMVATIVDHIEFCTACHAEGRGFEPRRSRHLQRLTAVIASVPTFQVGFRL